MTIRPLSPADVEAVVDLSIRAWAPVFASLERALGLALFRTMHPDGWQVQQRAAVRSVLEDAASDVWVADHEDVPVGFVAVRLHPDDATGEIYMIAVDPDHQGRGVGRTLTDHAIARIRDAGLPVAMVETGGDPGHAPARALYETAGFTRLTVARYFKQMPAMPRVDRASRVIGTPPSVVYGAFEDPRAMEAWLPPSGMTGHMEAFDFRSGGRYRIRLTYSDPDHGPGKSSPNSDTVDVELIRLVPDERIEQAVTFESDDPRFAGVMKMTWTFSPVPRGTEVTVRVENVPPGIRPEDHAAGLASTLENLARFTEPSP